MNDQRTSSGIGAIPVPPLLRVAAVQLARLDPEDRAALLPFVNRDMEAVR